jgi:type I restriction enzyme S subunit
VLTISDEEIKILQAKLDYLKEEKRGLVQQLLSGKRRVRVNELEVA